ncbi:hypothetical protein HYR54_00550 [Candidatus Acetothermia bacterium]|nr:hypothetical protein [Candidatus Acetothermia bacterium]
MRQDAEPVFLNSAIIPYLEAAGFRPSDEYLRTLNSLIGAHIALSRIKAHAAGRTELRESDLSAWPVETLAKLERIGLNGHTPRESTQTG